MLKIYVEDLVNVTHNMGTVTLNGRVNSIIQTLVLYYPGVPYNTGSKSKVYKSRKDPKSIDKATTDDYTHKYQYILISKGNNSKVLVYFSSSYELTLNLLVSRSDPKRQLNDPRNLFGKDSK